ADRRDADRHASRVSRGAPRAGQARPGDQSRRTRVTKLRVERMRLRLSGISRDEASRLAVLVGHGLSGIRARPHTDRAEQLQVAIDARAGETVQATADRIAVAVAQ